MTQPNQSELERQVHKLFGDNQGYDGGYQSCYDGKWIDMTNEVVSVADYITANYTPNSEVMKLRLENAAKLANLDQKIQTMYTEKEAAERERVARIVTGDTSDGYHTFNELYAYREAYNAALFNEWAEQKKYKVHKSWHHSDEPHEPIFGGGWFIVMAELPTGQISNHYEAKYWDDFKIPETPVGHAWDGHTPQEALERLAELTKAKDRPDER